MDKIYNNKGELLRQEGFKYCYPLMIHVNKEKKKILSVEFVNEAAIEKIFTEISRDNEYSNNLYDGYSFLFTQSITLDTMQRILEYLKNNFKGWEIF